MTRLDRRGFVKLGAGGALLFGVPFARADKLVLLRKEIQEGPAAPPVGPINWAQFRDEMKKRNQPGVIVVLQAPGQPEAQGKPGPAAEDAKRKQLAAMVHLHQGNPLASAIHTSLFSCGDSELPLLLVQAVFVAAPADQARKEFSSLPANAGLALVGVDGKVLATLPIDGDMGKKFTDRAAELLYGKDDARLAERVKAERTVLGEAGCKQFDTAVRDLDDDVFARRQGASEALTSLFPRIPASLAQARRGAESLEVRTRIDSLFRRKLHDENTAALFQRSLAPHLASNVDFNLRIKCGQGALLPHAHEFVQLWCKGA